MSDLSNYRAAIKRLIEAENVSAAFAKEGYDSRTAEMVSSSKSFKASRSASQVTQARAPVDVAE